MIIQMSLSVAASKIFFQVNTWLFVVTCILMFIYMFILYVHVDVVIQDHKIIIVGVRTLLLPHKIFKWWSSEVEETGAGCHMS